MTIRSIDTIALNLPFEIYGPPPKFAGKDRHMEILLVRVETDKGLVGWGEAFGFGIWPATRAAIHAMVAPLAIGQDERDIGALMADLNRKLHIVGRTGPTVYALAGLDIALWDIAGKAANKPLSELIGGAKHNKLPCYASLMRYTVPTLVAENAARVVARGYPAVKLHEIGEPQVKAAREAIGPDVELMMDVNCPWTIEEALKIADSVRPYDLAWFEEPVWPPEDFAGLAEVRKSRRERDEREELRADVHRRRRRYRPAQRHQDRRHHADAGDHRARPTTRRDRYTALPLFRPRPAG
jgi:L-alanine-DL-glutamate epimerase-like enolase superfamily enzyme